MSGETGSHLVLEYGSIRLLLGIDVPQRGPVPSEVVEKYNALMTEHLQQLSAQGWEG